MDLREYMRTRRERKAQKRHERRKAHAENAAAMHRYTEEAKLYARRSGGSAFDGGAGFDAGGD